MKSKNLTGPFASVAAPPLPGILVRNSRLSSEYIKDNLDAINMPVKVELDPSFDEMPKNWTEKELLHERRLVQLTIHREGRNVFRIKSEAVPPNYGVIEKNVLVISCIRWDEKDAYVLTSVDLLHVLENLVGETFSTQEKSRIRRNLQFLRPVTVNRTSSARLFNSVMAMENPRPRNIEKDLKVFRWLSLYVALTKVLSKYSVNPASGAHKLLPLQDVANGHTGRSARNSVDNDGNENYGLIENNVNSRADVPTVTTAPLPVNSLTALPRSIALKASPNENRPRPRNAHDYKPTAHKIGASSSRARIILEQGLFRNACSVAVL